MLNERNKAAQRLKNQLGSQRLMGPLKEPVASALQSAGPRENGKDKEVI